MNRIVSKTFLSEKVAKLVVEAPLIAKSRRAGHFVIVRVTDHSERVPYTIADADVDAGTITRIVQAVGESSQRLVALNAGDMIHDIVGPLGPVSYTHLLRRIPTLELPSRSLALCSRRWSYTRQT